MGLGPVTGNEMLSMLDWLVGAPEVDREEAQAARKSVVEPAEVSKGAKEKADTKKTAEGLTVHSFSTLMRHLATVTLNMSTLAGSPDCVIPVVTEQTPTQSRAFELLEVDPRNLLP